MLSYFGIVSVLYSFMESGRSEVMLLPRYGDSAVEGGGRCSPYVLVRLGEGGRLHGVVLYRTRAYSVCVVIKSGNSRRGATACMTAFRKDGTHAPRTAISCH